MMADCVSMKDTPRLLLSGQPCGVTAGMQGLTQQDLRTSVPFAIVRLLLLQRRKS
jgi:hypothetical protein